MKQRKKKWAHLSLRRKITVLTAVILIIMGLSASVIVTVTNAAVHGFGETMQDNLLCSEAQEALEEEKRTFHAYVREPSVENQALFERACWYTEYRLSILPFDYTLIGEERYARTWNLIHGYEGYKKYRDLVAGYEGPLQQETDEFYEVVGMQDALSTYALRLVQETLEEGNRNYRSMAVYYQMLPALSIGAIIVMLLLVMRLLKTFLESLVNPLIIMAEGSRKMSENDFNIPDLESVSEDEIGELIRAFNRMKQIMGHYISTLEEKNRIAELLHREAVEKLEVEKRLESTRLEMLKSQVNPHFLFNTLNMISCMARIEEAGTTDRMIISLSNLFRYNLRTTEQEVYLEEEIGALEDYIYIQQMRFDHRISYEKSVLVDAGKVKIPSFTLQPVVENAFIHGLSSKEEGGVITLRIWEENQTILILIADNGKGMPAEQLEELRNRLQEGQTSGRGIGLGNIYQRISILYQGGAFEIFSEPEQGTTIRIQIPKK